MIAVNELKDCHKRAVLEPLAVLISPFALSYGRGTVESYGAYRQRNAPAAIQWRKRNIWGETHSKYPVMIKANCVSKAQFSLSASPAEVEKAILADARLEAALRGRQ